jgi:hypothetical protein
MSTTYTSNLKLGKPAVADRNWDVPVNANADTLEALSPIGGLCVSPAEIPSASLNVRVAAGAYQFQDGTVGSYAGNPSYGVTASSTVALYLDLTAAGALTAAGSFPATAHIRLATVVAGVAAITSITDARVVCGPAGAIADGVSLTVGTTTGLKIGTATTQKLGFFGHTPAVQPTMGAATASGSYTSAEQTMLNAVYSAVRALGLGS